MAFKFYIINLEKQAVITSTNFHFVSLPRCFCNALRASVKKAAIS